MRYALLTLLSSLITVGVLFPMEPASAQGGGAFTEFVPITKGLFDALGLKPPIEAKDAVPILLNGLFRLTVGVAALLAVIMVAIGGVQYMTTDSSFNLGNARERISSAIIGLAIVLLCVLVFNLINARLTSLDLFKLKGPPGGFTTGVSIP